MTRRVPVLLGCLLCCMTLPRLAHSQLPVIDISNLSVNTTTSIQAVITAVVV